MGRIDNANVLCMTVFLRRIRSFFGGNPFDRSHTNYDLWVTTIRDIHFLLQQVDDEVPPPLPPKAKKTGQRESSVETTTSFHSLVRH